MINLILNSFEKDKQVITAYKVLKSINKGIISETLTEISLNGIVAPLKETELKLKPTEMRFLRWYKIYAARSYEKQCVQKNEFVFEMDGEKG